MYSPCVVTNIVAIVISAFAYRMAGAMTHPHPMVFIIPATIFIVGQFLYMSHRFKPAAATISVMIVVFAILLLRIGLGNSPFVLDANLLLLGMIAFQVIKFPIS